MIIDLHHGSMHDTLNEYVTWMDGDSRMIVIEVWKLTCVVRDFGRFV